MSEKKEQQERDEKEEIRREARVRFSYTWAFGLTALTVIGWFLLLETDDLLLLLISAIMFYSVFVGLFYMVWKVIN